MKKYLLISVIVILLVPCCSNSADNYKTDNTKTLKIKIAPSFIWAEPGQEIIIEGKGFPLVTIPQDSILIGDYETKHQATRIGQDGILAPLKITIPKALPSGQCHIYMAGESFKNAVNVEPFAITVAVWDENSELVISHIKKFKENFPDISVQVNVLSNDYYGKLKNLFKTGSYPDVLFINPEYFKTFGKYLENIDPYIKDDTEFNPDEFFMEIADAISMENQFCGFPISFSTTVLYYNKILFDQSGISYPDNWTWSDFFNAVEKLTLDINNDNKIDQYGFIPENHPYSWLPWLWQNGGDINDKSKTIETLEFYLNLYSKYGLNPLSDETDPFMSGKAAMVISDRSKCSKYKNISDFEWDVAEPPYKSTHASVFYSTCFGIAKGSKHKNAGWELIKHFLSEDMQTDIAESLYAIPIRKDIANSDTFYNSVSSDVHSEYFLQIIPYCRKIPSLFYSSLWTGEWYDGQLNRIYNGYTTPKEAAKELYNVLETLQ